MKILSITAAALLIPLAALLLYPGLGAFHAPLTIAVIAVAILTLAANIMAAREGAAAQEPVSAVRAASPPTAAANQADIEVVGLLGLLQEKGRLVDFLMDDITAYEDGQIGAAARVVHEGCRRVLTDHFAIEPIRAESEGAQVRVEANYGADEYRLSGRISGKPPFTGTLVHRGWRTRLVKMPRIVRPAGDRLPAIAPAEVELSRG